MDAQTQKPKSWMYLVIGALVVAALAWLFATSHFGEDLLPRASFAGCYISAKGDTLELDASGALRSRDATVGTFVVDAPVGGKHGPLIQVDGISVFMKCQNDYFARGRDGWFWPVTSDELQVTVYPPGTLVTFRKATASRCR